MSWVTVWFIRTSIVYLGIATLIGIAMTIWTDSIGHGKFAHVHLNLLGWMSMMIYGVGYHILPRFSGKQLWSDKLSRWQFWTAQIGLIGMVLSYPFSNTPNSFFISFAIIESVSVFLFLLNMFKTISRLP